MSKENLQKQYKNLYEALSQFNSAHYQYKNGSNKKKRDLGERDADDAISMAKNIIYSDIEIYKLASGGDAASNMDRANIFDEFFNYSWFSGDMSALLKNIEVRIKELDNEQGS